MAGHCRIDTWVLVETADALDALKAEFAAPKDLLQERSSAVGARELLAVLDEFDRNWRVNRESLTASMDAVSRMARSAHETYTDVELRLSQHLDRVRECLPDPVMTR